MANHLKVNNKRVGIGTAIALVVDVALYFIGNASAATWQVGLQFPISLPIIVFATLAPMLIGALVVNLLSKRWKNTVNFTSWAALIFAIAGAPGGYISSNDLPTGIALGSMHFVVGLTWFFSIRGKK